MTILSFTIGILIMCSTAFIGLAAIAFFVAIFMEKEKHLFTFAALACTILFIALV